MLLFFLAGGQALSCLFGGILYPLAGFQPRLDKLARFLAINIVHSMTSSAVGLMIGALVRALCLRGECACERVEMAGGWVMWVCAAGLAPGEGDAWGLCLPACLPACLTAIRVVSLADLLYLRMSASLSVR